MAIIFNPLLGDVSGKCGNVLFRKQYGKIIMQPVPTFSRGKTTKRQMEVRLKFEEAVLETRIIIHNPELSAKWDARCGKGISLFHRVMSEILKEN